MLGGDTLLQGDSPEFLPEFPWSVCGFRDILTPNVSWGKVAFRVLPWKRSC